MEEGGQSLSPQETESGGARPELTPTQGHNNMLLSPGWFYYR